MGHRARAGSGFSSSVSRVSAPAIRGPSSRSRATMIALAVSCTAPPRRSRLRVIARYPSSRQVGVRVLRRPRARRRTRVVERPSCRPRRCRWGTTCVNGGDQLGFGVFDSYARRGTVRACHHVHSGGGGLPGHDLQYRPVVLGRGQLPGGPWPLSFTVSSASTVVTGFPFRLVHGRFGSAAACTRVGPDRWPSRSPHPARSERDRVRHAPEF